MTMVKAPRTAETVPLTLATARMQEILDALRTVRMGCPVPHPRSGAQPRRG